MKANKNASHRTDPNEPLFSDPLPPYASPPSHTRLWNNLSVSSLWLLRLQAIPEQSTQVRREQAESARPCGRTQVP